MAPMMRTAMASVILAGLAMAGHAQTPAPANRPIQATPILLANVNYWRTHGEPGAALKELQRLLSFTPRNPDLIAAAAEVAFDLNDYAAANQYRAMLATVAPDDPRNQSLAAERERTPQESAMIADARQAARDGKAADALALYNNVFHGTVPPSLAVEYYEVLAASSPEGADEAQQKLGALADQQPNNLLLQLGYARILALAGG